MSSDESERSAVAVLEKSLANNLIDYLESDTHFIVWEPIQKTGAHIFYSIQV